MKGQLVGDRVDEEEWKHDLAVIPFDYGGLLPCVKVGGIGELEEGTVSGSDEMCKDGWVDSGGI